MTTTSATLPPSIRPSRHIAVPALAATVGAVALNAFGIWADGTPSDGNEALVTFLVVDVVIAVGAAVVFGWIVPRGLRRLESSGRAGAGALVLSALALLLVAVFWTGLPPVLAVGGIVLGLAGRGAERGGLATAGAAVGLLAVLADVAVYISDWMSTNGMM